MPEILLGNIKGKDGADFKIIDYFETPEALAAAITNPMTGDAYGVGLSHPYDIYIYSASGEWVNNGLIQGPQGPPGDAGTLIAEATSRDGITYTATIDNATELYNGMEIIIIPNTSSTSKEITLNVNGLGDVPIRRPLSFSTFASTSIDSDESYFLLAATPCRLMYLANYTPGGIWLMADKQKTSAQDLYGVVPVENGGTGVSNLAALSGDLFYILRTLEGVQSCSVGTYTGTGGNTAPQIYHAGNVSLLIIQELGYYEVSSAPATLIAIRPENTNIEDRRFLTGRGIVLGSSYTHSYVVDWADKSSYNNTPYVQVWNDHDETEADMGSAMNTQGKVYGYMLLAWGYK